MEERIYKTNPKLYAPGGNLSYPVLVEEVEKLALTNGGLESALEDSELMKQKIVFIVMAHEMEYKKKTPEDAMAMAVNYAKEATKFVTTQLRQRKPKARK